MVKFGVGLRVCRRLIISGETPCDTCGDGMCVGGDGFVYVGNGCGFEVGGAGWCTI